MPEPIMNSNLDPRITQSIAERKPTIPWRRRTLERFAKRAMDFLVTLILIVPLAPIMLITAILVKLTSRGPILLHQIRIGLDGQPYSMFKFRTMLADNPDGSARGGGEVSKVDNRLTPIGSWVRAWRLDELPQLLHVLSGRMSLVGPRPDLPINLHLYTDEQLLRFAMPPGCTAWTFTRGAFANDWSTRQTINVEYVQQWSLWLDIKIIFGSFMVLLTQKNANPDTAAKPKSTR
jgi:lipopolysaccharide/colanic/teichoic acid biosynthesis glycosyltransferase